MTSPLLHPALPFAIAALLVPWLPVIARRLLSLAAPLVALAALILLPDGAQLTMSALGHDWILLRLDALSRVFALAFILYAMVAGIYAWTQVGGGEKSASLGLAGAGVGVVMAGDLLSLFFFWEWLAVTSLFLIWLGRTPGAWAAGFRYVIFHLAGGVTLLMGVLMQMAEGAVAFEALAPDRFSSWLILGGMLVNAAVPPLHAWLSDAYPRASIYGTVFLAAFTTKAAVYALARGFPGLELLVWAGAVMALLGTVFALLENDIRRLLAYSIISQVGYMVTAVGVGSALALNGAAAHAFSHIFYKGLLLMGAGAVIHATGRGRLSELGQLARPLRWVLAFTMVGALAISAVPLFSGFVTKSMVISAVTYAELGAIELVLLVASLGTFLHTGLKLQWFTFFGEDRGARVLRPVPASMYIAMGLGAVVCIVPGVAPGATLYALLPFDASYNPFTAHHLIESLQLLVATGLVFWMLRVKLAGRATVTLDIDTLYRRPLFLLVEGSGAALEAVGRRVRARTGAAIAMGWRTLQGYRDQRGPATLAFQTTIIVAAITVAAIVVILLQG